MRIYGSGATVISANCSVGALDSGGRHSTQTKHSCTKAALLMRVAAHGIIVPLLCTPDDARSLVQSAKFPPVGRRGFGSPFSMERFGIQTQTEVSPPFSLPHSYNNQNGPTTTTAFSRFLITGAGPGDES